MGSGYRSSATEVFQNLISLDLGKDQKISESHAMHCTKVETIKDSERQITPLKEPGLEP